MATIDKCQLLLTNPLFHDLDAEVIDRIAALGTTRRLEPDQLLFSKGDEGDALYGILAGRIKISASAASGKEVVLNVLDTGEVFGEIALLDGQLRTAAATAMGATELMRINRRDFINYLEREPRLATHLLEMLCGRIRATTELVEDSAFLGLSARLAKRLLNLARFYGDGDIVRPPVDLKISQAELGQLMDTSREAINRHLQQWRKNGWVKLARGRITIQDVDALQGLVDADQDN